MPPRNCTWKLRCPLFLLRVQVIPEVLQSRLKNVAPRDDAHQGVVLADDRDAVDLVVHHHVRRVVDGHRSVDGRGCAHHLSDRATSFLGNDTLSLRKLRPHLLFARKVYVHVHRGEQLVVALHPPGSAVQRQNVVPAHHAHHLVVVIYDGQAGEAVVHHERERVEVGVASLERRAGRNHDVLYRQVRQAPLWRALLAEPVYARG
mmetsp:Transcript_8866/g.15944  ORF Transcript_8866/g.15944 Transcript_8866/m.15944 type:complete len:204 (-) Transcript_8866:406-1017(-)